MTPDDVQILRDALAAGLKLAVEQRARIEADNVPCDPRRRWPAEDAVDLADAALPALDRLLARLEAARADALEQAATAVEKQSYRARWLKAGANASTIEPCEFAAAIRALKDAQ